MGMSAARTIELTGGRMARVDADVWDCIGRPGIYNWSSVGNGRGKWYGRRSLCCEADGVKYLIWLHRLICGAPQECLVKFRDGDTLNCMRENLVAVDAGSGKELEWSGSVLGSSRFRGVLWDSRYGIWKAVLWGLVIGYSDSEIGAARLYNAKAREVWGNGGAQLNTAKDFVL